MMTEEQMKREALSRAYIIKLSNQELADLDRYLITHINDLSDEQLYKYSSRIRYLKQIGVLRCGSLSNGKETFGLTSETDRYLRGLPA